MEQGIKQSFQKKMDTDPDYKKYGMKVQKVTLIKAGLNSYDGFVTVLIGNKTHEIPISVKADGSQYFYETKPLAFAFLIKYNLQNLFKQ